MIGYMGHKVDGISIGSPPFLSVVSLELARRVLNKSYPKQNVDVPLSIVTSDQVKVGETVFPICPTASLPISPGAGRTRRQTSRRGGAERHGQRDARREFAAGVRAMLQMVAADLVPAVEGIGLSRSYGGVRALNNATFSALPGEVHALVGENGAGKSTLIKILGGRVRPSPARCAWGAKPCRSPAPMMRIAPGPGRCSRN